MGLFSKRPKGAGHAQPMSGKQIPEQRAEDAYELYMHQRFAEAAEQYASAIDAIDTMCYMTPIGSRRRAPSFNDKPILEGFNNAIGAAMAMDQSFVPAAQQLAEKVIIQLARVAQEHGVDDEARDLYAVMQGQIQFTASHPASG